MEVLFGLQESKAKVASYYTDVRLAIDDRIDVVVDYQPQSGINNALLYSQKWNEHAAEMQHVHNLPELTQLLRSNKI